MGENKTKGLHDGHRDRVRKRFEENGLEGFYDHQVLEFLLFYGIPRKDTNDIAHNLLNKFGSLSAMFDTTVESLEESGLSYNAAILIKLISEVCARYYQDKYHQKEVTRLSNELLSMEVKPSEKEKKCKEEGKDCWECSKHCAYNPNDPEKYPQE